MLPDDAKERRQAAIDKNAQSMVTDHFKPQTDEDKPIIYSDKLFASAAIEWLVDADLVSISFNTMYCSSLIAWRVLATSSLQPAILQEDD